MRKLHGEGRDAPALDEARIDRLAAAAAGAAGAEGAAATDAAVTAAAVDPANAHAFGFLFPALQADPANLLPEAADTASHLAALGVAMQGVGGESHTPAGYTYFGQFVDHDVTLEGVTGSVDLNGPIAPMSPADLAATLANTRTGLLDLDSVYAAPAPRDPADPALMQLGVVSPTGGRPPGKGTDNDLPRRPRDPNPDLDRAALIGDPRNDENLIVAQLHLGFLKAHNALVRQGLSFDDAQRTLRQHYQHVVVHDYLKRIADPAVVDDIVANGPKAFDPAPGTVVMPLEFSVAAYRFGHTMIREGYDVNRNFPFATLRDLFTFTALSGQVGGFASLPENWIVEWERFLDAGRAVMPTRAFDTFLVEPLAQLTDTLSVPLAGNMARLAVRNLLRGYLLRLPTGQAVATALGFTPLTPAELAAAAGNDAQRAALVAGGFDVRTPLWYYVLAEAAHGGGQRLGPVGSTIVADVLVGLLRRSPDSILDVAGWAPTLPSRTPATFTLLDLLVFAGVATDFAVPPPDPDGDTYTVEPGDSLFAIAERELGDGDRWHEIFALNRDRIENPRVIFAGQVLRMPPADVGEATHTIVVRPGDTLWDIASDELGDATRWPEIFHLNAAVIDDPRLIFPGQELRVPG